MVFASGEIIHIFRELYVFRHIMDRAVSAYLNFRHLQLKSL